MVKKDAIKAKPKKVLSVPRRMDSASVEAETIKRVTKTISTLENFLTKWDRAKLKPKEMYPHVTKIRKFHTELVAWRKKASSSKNVDEEMRARRLRNFIFICKTYS